MKKLLVILVAMIAFSGCIGQTTSQKTVKLGDNISIDYIGTLTNGNIFDTNIEKIAKENNLSIRNNKPLRFIVGRGILIKGLEEGVVGMRLEESKTLTIPPEKALGQKNPQLIQTIPIVQNISIIKTFPKIFNMSIRQFGIVFGTNHKIGDTIKIPDTNINLTIQNITSSNVLASYNLLIGSEISQSGVPWNDTVIKIDDNNIIARSNVKENEKIQLEGWNATVINVDSDNITLKHNSIPDTKIQTQLGTAKVHFNNTFITIDQNNELAGETLIFNVTIRSIN